MKFLVDLLQWLDRLSQKFWIWFDWIYCFSFAVDKSLLEKHFLQGQTFEQAYKNDRLFYVDYKDLDGYIAKASKEVIRNIACVKNI